MARKKKNEYSIQSVSRALDLLEQFQGDAGELKHTELSRLLQSNKNYVVRLLATLEHHDFVAKNQRTGGYSLGHTLLRLSRTWLGSKRLLLEGRQSLKEVSAACRETVYLAALREKRVTYLDRIESNQPVGVASLGYPNLPFHCTAPGKLLLAHAEEKECSLLLERKGLQKHTVHTIVSMRSLMKHLQEVREQGFAVDRDEFEQGLCGAAAPIRNHAGQIVGAVGVVGPSFRLEAEKLRGELAQLLVKAGRETSMRLGYREPEEAQGDGGGYRGAELQGSMDELVPYAAQGLGHESCSRIF